ncbi:MAG: tetratricopeptide repeat protein [Gammaproteobacteria bacterium]|nr:tetratricopeptide repeat protein [Gammaproteobacteria bacterium]
MDKNEGTDENQEHPTQEENQQNFPRDIVIMGFSPKKIVFIALIIIVLGLGGWYAKHRYTLQNLRKQTALEVLTQSRTMTDIQQYLGTGVTLGKKLSGTIDNTGQNASLTIDVVGSKGHGTLTSVLMNGQLTTLSLDTQTGMHYDVLSDEAAYQKKLAVKAALAAAQQALVTNFNNAVNAIAAKNYQVAIEDFMQSVKNNYNVGESYQYLGFSYSATNQYPLCVSSYEKYLQSTQNDAKAYYQLAYCYLQMYQTQKALVNLDASCALSYQTACDAAAQIKSQLNQKPSDNPYAPLSPQQSITQQQSFDGGSSASVGGAS